MKVLCKCCHKMFDYDMYMGLCPKCGRVYRRGKGMYSDVERDMIGSFHIHGDEGGLNRGIHGVVYNQSSNDSFQEMLEPQPTGFRTEGASPIRTQMAALTTPRTQMAALTTPRTQMAAFTAPRPNANANNYYSPNHKTQLNQGIRKQQNNSGLVIFIMFLTFFIIGFILSMLDFM